MLMRHASPMCSRESLSAKEFSSPLIYEATIEAFAVANNSFNYYNNCLTWLLFVQLLFIIYYTAVLSVGNRIP